MSRFFLWRIYKLYGAREALREIRGLRHKVGIQTPLGSDSGRGGRPVGDVADERIASPANVGGVDLPSSDPSRLPLNSGWVLQVPDCDLSTLHHGLRLSAKYPGMADVECKELTNLADLCWDEHARRCSERLEIEKGKRV